MIWNVAVIFLPITFFFKLFFKKISREFPGSPMVRIQGFHCGGLGSILGQETRVLQAAWHSWGEKKRLKFLKSNHI